MTTVISKHVPHFEGPTPLVDCKVGLLTGGFDPHYAVGLAKALASKGVALDVIGSDELDRSDLRSTPNLTFLNFLDNRRAYSTFARKVLRIAAYYGRLVRYAAFAEPKIFHILWNNKLQFLDRTFLMLYYKALGKQIALTVHNVNAGKRDGNDSWVNRRSLRIQYHLADHLFVHTERMKRELMKDFGIAERVISVIPFGINNCVPHTDLTSIDAKRKLGIGEASPTILFFGAIQRYKGLDYLVDAFQRLAHHNPEYRLIIAGEPKRGSEKYLDEIQARLGPENRSRVIQRLHHIPDEETELYFKAADVLALPYTEIFQSGVLILAYSFGLPVLAADVGSFREDVIEGQTGFLFKPRDPIDLANAIQKYFHSNLFENLDEKRQEIRTYADVRHSWDDVGDITQKVYRDLTSCRD